MLIDSATWDKVSELFDQLVTLSGDQREKQIKQLELDEAISDWLKKLLAAHDSDATHVLDQTIDQMAKALIAENAPAGGKIPDDIRGRQLGNWRVTESIARGAMAAVFHGERADGAYEQHVAIKLLQPGPYRHSESEQLREELRLLARLEHPGIARLLDGGISDQGWPYLVLEYVDGVHIDQWCAEQRPDWRQRVQLMLNVCDAVRYAHSKLVVHADIKPSNVLVNRDGEPKLVDFGIAGLLRRNPDSDPPAASALLRCSPAYAAPEQFRGEPVSTGNDVFGLGALLYELLTGKRIRDDKTVTALLLGREPTDQITPPCQLAGGTLPGGSNGKDLNAICLQALAQDPQQRYGSVTELRQDLRNTLQRYPVAARANTALYRLNCWLRRNYLVAGACAAVVIALVSGIAVALWQADRAELAADQARQNAMAAAFARAEAESALARADAINDFLVELFQANIPRVPRDEMPTTAEVVESGIERARDPATGPPEVRASLLLTLGNVILHRLEPDRAEQLLNDASALIDEHALDIPRIRIDAVLLRADIAMVRDEATNVAAAADDAIALLQAHRPDSIELLEIMRLRAQAEWRIGSPADARNQLEDIYARAEDRDDAEALRLKIAQDLAILAGMAKDFEAAIEQFENVLRVKKTREDIIPNELATTEFNIAFALVELGRFERAGQRLEQTLEYLKEIDAPNPVRASALLAIGEAHRLQGQLEPALEKYREAAWEWAHVMDLERIEDDYLIHHRRALAYATAGRIDMAVENMQLAIEQMERGTRHHPPDRIDKARAMLAALYCRVGRARAADNLLAAIDGHLDPTLSFELAQARGECALADLAATPDPALVPMSVIEEHAWAPGRAIETAELELLRARLLARSDNPGDAVRLLDSAAARIEPLNLADNHSLVAAFHDFRSRLSAR